MESVRQARPSTLYFNLLSEQDLQDLRPILEAIRERRDELLEGWYSLYLLHFGADRSISRSEFLRIYGADLDAIVANLARKDLAGFTTAMANLGNTLAERRVPFAEVVASMHLFEESTAAVVATDVMSVLYPTFDKLSHCRIIVLADAYFRSHMAASATRIRSLEQEAAQIPVQNRSRFHGLVGASPVMRQLYERIEMVAATRGTVFIVGESGTGKELVARAIHECGPDSNRPFMALNCAAIPRELVDSELFGYKRGAFSGATAEYLGLFRAAEGGTLFLDEITEMSPATQSKLLRAIQERRVRPVGSTTEVAVDVRLIASTNRDPEEGVRSGQLREDLYYRLQVNVLRVPPLRERIEDIPLLTEHFIALLNQRLGGGRILEGIEPEALEELTRRKWPGNVRELANAIESARTFGRSPLIRREDLPPANPIVAGNGTASSAGVPQTKLEAEKNESVPTFADVERDLIVRALETTHGNKVQAAKLLSISRKRLYAKIRKYSLHEHL